MKYQKKGIAIGTLIIIIIILLAAVPMFIFSGEIAEMIGRGASDEACRLSILAQSKLKFVGSSPVSVECPRKSIIFYDDHVEEIIEGHKKDLGVKINNIPKKKFKELNSKIVNQVIAEELRKCWRKTGEGEIDAFEEDMLLGAEVCLLCATFEFDESVKAPEFSGLEEYLESHYIPKEDEKISYYDYLSKEQTFRLLWIFSKKFESLYNQVETITPDEKYVIFMKAVKANPINEFFRSSEDSYFVFVGTNYWIANACVTLLN